MFLANWLRKLRVLQEPGGSTCSLSVPLMQHNVWFVCSLLQRPQHLEALNQQSAHELHVHAGPCSTRG